MKDHSNEQLKRLRFACHLMAEKGVDYQSAISVIDNQLPKSSKARRINIEHLPLYRKIRDKASAKNVNADTLKYEFLKTLVGHQALAYSYSVAIRNVVSYSLSVIVCSIIVFSIIGIKVLPEFKNIYLNSGYQAPGVTHWVIEWSQFYWLTAEVVGVVTISAIVIAQVFANCLKIMEPLNRVMKLIIPKKLASRYHDYLNIQFVNALVNSGAAVDEAIDDVSQCVLGEKGQTKLGSGMSSLQQASKLEIFDHELKYQLQQSPEILITALFDFKQLMSRVVFFISAVFVGISLIAVYLPLFHLGQAF